MEQPCQSLELTTAGPPGVISAGFGIVIFFLLPDTPERVKRGFTVKEKEIAIRRSKEAYNAPNARPNLRQLGSAVRDTKTWFYSKPENNLQ